MILGSILGVATTAALFAFEKANPDFEHWNLLIGSLFAFGAVWVWVSL